MNPRIFDYVGLPRPGTLERAGYETESGQILIDRRRCFDAVQIAWHWSARPRHFRLFFYGDTEIYRLAFGVTGRHFHQIHQPSWHAGVVEDDVFHGKAMIPRDESGEPMFLHQMHRKPSLGGSWRALSHVTRDAAVDHPRPRAVKDVTMLAPVASLSDLGPLDGPLEKIEERIRVARESLLVLFGLVIGAIIHRVAAPGRPFGRAALVIGTSKQGVAHSALRLSGSMSNISSPRMRLRLPRLISSMSSTCGSSGC